MSHLTIPSARAQFITRRTYNRPLNEEGTLFETWEQTVDRVLSHQRWLWVRELGDELTSWQEEELVELRHLMLGRLAVPAGRTMWLGGTETAKRREASQFNPCRRSTRFVTIDGVRSFEDFEDGASVIVMTHAGRWKSARVVKAGVQPINKITFARGRNTQVEYFTPTHTWILRDGTRTQDLQVGDRIVTVPSEFYAFRYDDAELDEKYWWAYGLVYGDGALAKSGGSHTSRVRLCGDKAKYLPRFQELGFEFGYPPSCDGDPFVYTGKYLKSLPGSELLRLPAERAIKLLRAFVHGYLAADGHKNRNSARGGEAYPAIQATDPESQAFIENYFPVVGLYVLSKTLVKSETNYGPRSGDTYLYRLRADLNGTGATASYTVKSIEPQGDEDVWCLTVEDDHSFVLPNGVVTGNCSHLEIRTVHDCVDALWLLLQGCGLGFTPANGVLSGFVRRMEVEVVRSKKKPGETKGRETNLERYDPETRVWSISVGDSAEAWAKSIGKLLAGKYPAKKIVLDFSEIRAAGTRLKGYGWLSSGDSAIAQAFQAICVILNTYAGKLLSKSALWDIVNWLGTILSSRRSAQIGLIAYGDPEWSAVATRKYKNFDKGPDWYRCQSNNTVKFYEPPNRRQMNDLFDLIIENGGSEPGFLNVAAALKRAPWFAGVNPCAEVLLGDKSFCNLCEIDLAKFKNDHTGLHRAAWLIARANYRQTCVNLRDGILQDAWHQTNEYLRLCGVGLTGICRRPDFGAWDYRQLKYAAVTAAYGMADELGRERPKNTTTVKPSGTAGKVLDTTEGAHKPKGRYILNHVVFSRHDPLVERLVEGGYRIRAHPQDPQSVLVGLPVSYEDVAFQRVGEHMLDEETAVEQLERYKLLMDNYVDQNVSITVSYNPSEKKSIVDWFLKNWDHTVATSFLFRASPFTTAEELGYSYLPQEVLTKDQYLEYTAEIKPVDMEQAGSLQTALDDDCPGGACPVR